jgi:hypothetical protein
MEGWIWVELKLCLDGANPMDQLFGAEHKREIDGCRLRVIRFRVMDRPIPDYPDDVTVYLVVNDFGKFGKAYVETDIAEADRITEPEDPEIRDFHDRPEIVDAPVIT